MKSKVVRLVFSALMTLSCAAAMAWSGDSTVNNPVCTAANPQENPQITPDGSGGVVIAWEDRRGGTTRDIYAQRLDANGTPLWTANGVKICGTAMIPKSIRLVSDGLGGAIISWIDDRNGLNTNDIYAQRVNGGTVQWIADGLPVCTATNTQTEMQIIRDGSTGAIVTWTDRRTGGEDVYAQRLDTTGNQVWAGNGLAICTEPGAQNQPQLAVDGAGGALITWRDSRTSGMTLTDIFAQKVTSAGVLPWGASGVAISTFGSSQREPAIVSDGVGGAIIAFLDQRVSNVDIYAQRVDGNGAVQWTANGAVACTEPNGQSGVRLASDGSNGAILTWYDDRASLNIYAQRIQSSNGAPQWNTDGVIICDALNRQSDPEIISDGSGGAIICWPDLRADVFEIEQDVYAQRVDFNGAVQWAANGLAICTYDNHEVGPQLATDTLGGAIITWQDGREDGEIYASRATAAGALPVTLSGLSIE